MPCNSVTVVTVEMKNVDKGLLVEDLRRLGAKPNVHPVGTITFEIGDSVGAYSNGALSFRMGRWATQADLVNKVKRAYSYEVVMAATRKVGALTTQNRDGTISVSVRRV